MTVLSQASGKNPPNQDVVLAVPATRSSNLSLLPGPVAAPRVYNGRHDMSVAHDTVIDLDKVESR